MADQHFEVTGIGLPLFAAYVVVRYGLRIERNGHVRWLTRLQRATWQSLSTLSRDNTRACLTVSHSEGRLAMLRFLQLHSQNVRGLELCRISNLAIVPKIPLRAS